MADLDLLLALRLAYDLPTERNQRVQSTGQMSSWQFGGQAFSPPHQTGHRGT